MDQEPTIERSADEVIAQYVLSACMLGAKFDGVPHPGYLLDTARTMLRDLKANGFDVVDRTPEGSKFAALLEWLTEDREMRSMEITVRANDPEWLDVDGGDRGDETAIWSWHYQLRLTEQEIFGDEEIDAAGGPSAYGGSASEWVHTGNGDSLDQAAAVASAMQSLHWQIYSEHHDPEVPT